MADLNIRNVDPKLIAELKSEAALFGTNLKSYVMAILAGGMRYDKRQADAINDRRQHYLVGSRQMELMGSADRYRIAVGASGNAGAHLTRRRVQEAGCPECGGLNGVHQKNCAKGN